MKEVKLFNLLECLTQKELKELENFVFSKVFNNDKSIEELYYFIRKNFTQIQSGKLSKDELYQHLLSGDKNFNESKYWKLTSSFATLIDKYLVFKEYEVDNYYYKNHLLEVYRRKNINKQFTFLSREIQKSFGKEFNKGMNYFLNQTHYYFQNISYLGRGDDNFDEDIERLFENLKMFFIMTNITSAGMVSNLKDDFLIKSASKIWLFEELLDYMKKNKSHFKKNYLTVYIFFLIVLSKLNLKKEEYYFEVRDLILSNINKLSTNLLKHMVLSILNYAINKMISGDEKYLKEISLLNRIMDENSLALTGESLHGDYFYSVIEHATMQNEISWAAEFAEKYKSYLSYDNRDSLISLGLSRIDFERKNYTSSLQRLLSVDNVSPYFYLSHKILLLQNYMELMELEAALQIIETLSKYLKRRIDIASELKDNYLKFLHYYRKLKNVVSGKHYLAKSLSKELDREKFFLQKRWLVEKVDMIKKKK